MFKGHLIIVSYIACLAIILVLDYPLIVKLKQLELYSLIYVILSIEFFSLTFLFYKIWKK